MPLILYVEGDDADAHLFRTALADTPTVNCHHVRDIESAKRLLSASMLSPTSDGNRGPALILCAYYLPRCQNGVDFVAWLRSHADADLRNVPAVLFSDTADDRLFREAYARGATACLRKPNLWSEWKAIATTLNAYAASPDRGELLGSLSGFVPPP